MNLSRESQLRQNDKKAVLRDLDEWTTTTTTTEKTPDLSIRNPGRAEPTDLT